MILVDSSAWIEWLRRTGSTIDERLDALISRGADIAITEPVAMELLAGARSEERADELRSTLYAYEMLNLHGLDDFERAALIFRDCRRAGQAVRRQLPCLIAAVAIREDVPLLCRDAAFEVIARHSALRIA